MNADIVYVKDLKKKYGNIEALRGISFNVRKGEIFGIVGPNGAGKTTTLRIIATLVKPTSGTVKVFGLDVVKHRSKVRKFIGYLPEDAGVYDRLTGWENLLFFAKLYFKDPKEVERAVEYGAKIAGLGDRIHDRTETYSKGMKRRLLLAKTLMLKPKLALLDEPTSGLDVFAAVEVRRLIKEYAKELNTTIILSSHNMLEVEYLCNRVALINNGIIVDIGSPKELKEKYNASNLEEAFVNAIRGSKK